MATQTESAIRDLWLDDIAHIRSVVDLRVWAARNAEELSASPFKLELREAYLARLKELDAQK